MDHGLAIEETFINAQLPSWKCRQIALGSHAHYKVQHFLIWVHGIRHKLSSKFHISN